MNSVRFELKAFLDDQGITAKEFAKKLGYSDAHVSNIINGLRNPSYDFFVRMKREYPSTNVDKIFLASDLATG